MRILIISQYFWPESFRINDLSVALVERGHSVEVLTGNPNYPNGRFYEGYSGLNSKAEDWNGIRIHRSPLISRGNGGGINLALNYLSFAFFALFRGAFIKGKFDKILVFEPSPITVGIPAIFMKWIKKVPIYFWVQDLWPESVTAAGGVQSKFTLKILDLLTKSIYKNSDRILIQSESFRKLILDKGVKNEKIIYYPNSVEGVFNILSKKEEYIKKLPEGFNVLFAGNIGESQDFDTILNAAVIVKNLNPKVNWVVLGDGRKKDYVAQKISVLGLEQTVYLLGSFPVHTMPDFFACADCLLVSLKRDYIFSLTIPSKIQSYLACGKPIVASLDGEGGRIIEEAKAGAVADAENPELLAAKIFELSKLDVEELEAMGRNSRDYFEKNFERELLVSRLEAIFNNKL